MGVSGQQNAPAGFTTEKGPRYLLDRVYFEYRTKSVYALSGQNTALEIVGPRGTRGYK